MKIQKKYYDKKPQNLKHTDKFNTECHRYAQNLFKEVKGFLKILTF